MTSKKNKIGNSRDAVITKSDKPLRFKISGINISDVISLHFTDISTRVSSAPKSENAFASSAFSANELRDDKSIEILPHSKKYEASMLGHEHDKIGEKADYFTNSKKQRIKIWPVMVDITEDGLLTDYTEKPCRNCHHSFTTKPIGCPIEYIEKDERLDRLISLGVVDTDAKYYFKTENVFCSKPCVRSYVLDCLSREAMSKKYCDALSYVTLLYMFDGDNKNIPENSCLCAQPINVLQAYGGHLTIDEYRASVGIVKYENTINTKNSVSNRIPMIPVFSTIEEI